MNGKSISFIDKKMKKVNSTTKAKRIFNMNNIDVNKILVSKKNNMAHKIYSNTLLCIMIMMLLDNYV